MFEIYRLFYDIVLFKKGPQDVPFSPFLTRLTLCGYVLVSFISLAMGEHWLSVFLQMLVDILLLTGFTRITLTWAHKSERFQQTFCALLGTDTLLTFVAIPVSAVILIPGNNDISVLASFAVFALILWHWAVIGYILKHALEQDLGFSLGLSLLYVMGTYWIIGLLFS